LELSPSQRLFADPRYQTLLQREAVPVINFADFPPQDWGGLQRFLVSLSTSALPTFIIHYPGSVCDRMNDGLHPLLIMKLTMQTTNYVVPCNSIILPLQ
jgi:hypothetical protein